LRITLGVFLFVISSFEWTFSQEIKQNIAVLDLKSNALDVPSIIGLSNKVRSELVQENEFTVIEREDMDAILREQDFQQTDCVESSCAVEIGKLLSVRKMVVGNIDLTGTTYSLTLRIVDVESAKIEKTASLDCINCSLDDALAGLVPNVCRKLAGLPYLENSGPLVSQKGAKEFTRQMHIGQFLTAFGGVTTLGGYALGAVGTSKDTSSNPVGIAVVGIGITMVIVGIVRWTRYHKKLEAILKPRPQMM
jgi:hypothetical protein